MLLHVLAGVPPAGRRLLPLVSRRWRRVAGTPSAALDSDVYLEFASDVSYDDEPESAFMYRWLQPRLGVIRGVTIAAASGARSCGLPVCCAKLIERLCRSPVPAPSRCRSLPLCVAEEDWGPFHLVLGLLAGGLQRLTVRGGREG